MRIGIDFDRVIIDTDSFDEHFTDKSGLYHVDKDVYDEYGCYSPKKHADVCGIDPEKVYSAVEGADSFVVDGVEKLKSLSDENELVIVTRGEERFQSLKIQHSGVRSIFDRVEIVQEKPKDHVGIDFLVDDREEEIDMTDVPGLKFDMEKHDFDYVVEKIKEISN